ncbi:MAG: preprotein translocase subunit SecE [Bdellovibrionota bacterium]
MIATKVAINVWQDMENNQQKWVNLTFVAASLLFAYILYALATKFSVVFDVEGRVRSLDKILMIATAVIGLGTFLGLSKNGTANSFMSETVSEIAKVTWPAQDETMKATVAVLIAVTIAGVMLWAVDNLWIYVIGLIIG